MQIVSLGNMKYQTLDSGKYKNIINMSSAEFVCSMLHARVNESSHWKPFRSFVVTLNKPVLTVIEI